MNAFWKEVFLFNRNGNLRTWTKRIDLNTSKPVALISSSSIGSMKKFGSVLDDLLSYHRTMDKIKAYYRDLTDLPADDSEDRNDLAWLSNDIYRFFGEEKKLGFIKKVLQRIYMNHSKNPDEVGEPTFLGDKYFTDIKVYVGLLLPDERRELTEFLLNIT